MTRKSWTARRGSEGTRVAWIVSFAVPLALVALLCLAKPGGANTTMEPIFPPEVEAELEEGFEEECEEVEEGLLECEGFEEPDAKPGPVPPEECYLRTARARVLVSPSRHTLRLVVRYTSSAPTGVYVDLKLRSGKGSLGFGLVKRRVSRKGLIRRTESLVPALMERALAARRFLVTIDVPAAPAYCDRYFTRRLTIKRKVHGQAVWLQSGSIFGGGR